MQLVRDRGDGRWGNRWQVWGTVNNTQEIRRGRAAAVKREPGTRIREENDEDKGYFIGCSFPRTFVSRGGLSAGEDSIAMVSVTGDCD